MNWSRTDAGQIELQAHDLVKERAQRDLLLVIDGQQSDETLLASLSGISMLDFRALESLGLIEPSDAHSVATPPPPQLTLAGDPADTAPATAAVGLSVPAPLDHAQLGAALTQLISRELGLRGFMLTIAVEQAHSFAELRSVARRAIEQIRAHRGDVAAAAAATALQMLDGE